jgi:N-acetylglucosaminyldiphosphoundecaprenol N-acetyl-beta-D-mannosaminyltransferase
MKYHYASNTICKFPISTAALLDNLATIDSLADSGKGGWVVTLNTEMLAKCSREKDYASLIRKADFFTADGMPLIWASKHNSQQPIKGRSTGVDIIESFLRRSSIPYFAIIGGVDPEATLKGYPNAIDSCKYLFTGKVDLSEAQLTRFVKSLRDNTIRYVFLALGVPKSDKLAFEIRTRYPEAVIIGVGGPFELLSSNIGSAPKWMQNIVIDWLFRLIK